MTHACLVAPRCDLAQFRTNVSEMGVDAAAADVDALFDSLDDDHGGSRDLTQSPHSRELHACPWPTDTGGVHARCVLQVGRSISTS